VISVIEFLKCAIFVDQRIDNELPVERSQLLLRLYGDEASVIQPVVRLPSASGSGTDVEDDLKAGPVLFMLPGLEGLASVLQPLARNLKYQTVCLQLGDSYIGQTVEDIAQALLPVQITQYLNSTFTALIKTSRFLRLFQPNKCVGVSVFTRMQNDSNLR
jgi:hypothetical protein